MKDQLLKIVKGNSAEVVQQLKEKGVRVRHRFGDTIVIEEPLSKDLSSAFAHQTKAITAELFTQVPAEVKDEEMPLVAYRMRQTEAYRRAKRDRSHKDEDWGYIFEKM